MTHFILFLISFLGINLAVVNYSRLKLVMAPFISVSIIASVMMIAGFLNILEPTVGIIQLLGILFALYHGYQFYRQKNFKQFFQKEFNFGILLYILGGLYFLFLLSNQELIHYDNFSHWGIIVKEIFLNNALPTEGNNLTAFTSYPTGTAVFIYYFMKVTHASEGMALFGQYLIISSSILTIFSVGNSWSKSVSNQNNSVRIFATNLVLTILSVYLLVGVRRLHDLLVDTVLVVIGIALVLTIVEMFKQKQINPLILTAILFFLTLVKNIGVLFAIIGLIIYIVRLFEYGQQKKIKNWLPVITPIIANQLWSLHVALAFPTTEMSKHEMSIENYSSTLAEKSLADIQIIGENFLEKMTNFNFSMLAMILLLLVLVMLVGKSQYNKPLIKGSLFFIGIFLIYIVGLLAMYVFSMPLNEALKIAAFNRYMDTMLIYVVAMISLLVLESIKNYRSPIYLALSSILFLLFGINSFMVQLDAIKNTFTIVEQDPKVTNLESSYPFLTDNKMLSSLKGDIFLIYEPENGSSSFQNYYMKYRFNSDDFIIVGDSESLEDQYKASDYILIPDSGKDIEVDQLEVTQNNEHIYKVN